ncbi:hypothetical protein ACFLWC_05875 [Chloroflexota bacterium]
MAQDKRAKRKGTRSTSLEIDGFRIALLDVKLVLVCVEMLPEVVRGRLEARLEDSETKSDADRTIYQRMRSPQCKKSIASIIL